MIDDVVSPIVEPDAIHLVVLTGMSGGGKTVALRALEDLERKGGLLTRETDEGNDWLLLTPAGAEEAGVAGVQAASPPIGSRSGSVNG